MVEVERHYSPEQAAEVCAVCVMTVRRAIAEGARTRGAAGLFPVRRLGRRYLVPASALARWVTALPVHGVTA